MLDTTLSTVQVGSGGADASAIAALRAWPCTDGEDPGAAVWWERARELLKIAAELHERAG